MAHSGAVQVRAVGLLQNAPFAPLMSKEEAAEGAEGPTCGALYSHMYHHSVSVCHEEFPNL